MGRQRGGLDRRLMDARRVTASVVAAVLKDHDCSDGQRCAACDYVLSRRQPICRSVAVAQGLRFGRAPQWAGTDDDTAAVPTPRDNSGEQLELFATGRGR